MSAQVSIMRRSATPSSEGGSFRKDRWCARSRRLTLQRLPGPDYIPARRLEVQVLGELDHLRPLVGMVTAEPRVAGADAQENRKRARATFIW
jgi:hypothetical protein